MATLVAQLDERNMERQADDLRLVRDWKFRSDGEASLWAESVVSRPDPAAGAPVNARDHNTGLSMRRSLHAYLKDQPSPAKKFFRGLVRDPRVVKLLDEGIAVVRGWQEVHRKGDRSAFDRMMLMRSRSFADGEARKLRDLLPLARERRFALH